MLIELVPPYIVAYECDDAGPVVRVHYRANGGFSGLTDYVEFTRDDFERLLERGKDPLLFASCRDAK